MTREQARYDANDTHADEAADAAGDKDSDEDSHALSCDHALMRAPESMTGYPLVARPLSTGGSCLAGPLQLCESTCSQMNQMHQPKRKHISFC